MAWKQKHQHSKSRIPDSLLQQTDHHVHTGQSERHSGYLAEAARLLEAGQTQEAFDALRAAPSEPHVKNARGVCLMRMNQPALAVRVFRELTLDRTGVLTRPDVPLHFRTNFATALLMDNNVSGCLSVLDELNADEHPRVRQIRAAIHHWASRLSWLKRTAWTVGMQPAAKVVIDFVPGDLGETQVSETV